MEQELILVRKLAYDGRETWRWSGRLVQRSDRVAVIDALFNGSPRDLGYMRLEQSDLFHEYYYSDRWFNIFQVFDSHGVLKGWYCNICKPAHLLGNEISFVDMVLDVFVYPDLRVLVLDQEEFNQKRETIYTPEDACQAEAESTLLIPPTSQAVGWRRQEGAKRELPPPQLSSARRATRLPAARGTTGTSPENVWQGSGSTARP